MDNINPSGFFASYEPKNFGVGEMWFNWLIVIVFAIIFLGLIIYPIMNSKKDDK